MDLKVNYGDQHQLKACDQCLQLFEMVEKEN